MRKIKIEFFLILDLPTPTVVSYTIFHLIYDTAGYKSRFGLEIAPTRVLLLSLRPRTRGGGSMGRGGVACRAFDRKTNGSVV